MNLKETIFKVPEEQDWIDLMRWLEDNTDLIWYRGNGKPTEFNNWESREKESTIIINDEICYSDEKYCREEYPNYTFLNARDFLNEHNIIQELNGIKVGDRVEYEGYKGYVAVIDPESSPNYMLRLDGYDGWFGREYWDNKWYPEHEKKEEGDYGWVSKGSFKVIEEHPRISISYRPISKSELKEINKINNNKTIMGTIKNAFKSKEEKAMEHFGLGTAKDLSESGREEFTDFVYETGSNDKKEFLKKIVEAYKEAK